MFALTMIANDPTKSVSFTQAVKPTLEEAKEAVWRALGEGAKEDLIPEWEWDGWYWFWNPDYQGWAFSIVQLGPDGEFDAEIS